MQVKWELQKKALLESKEVMRKHVGDEKYTKITDQKLYESAQKLLRLVQIVESEANA